MMNVTSVPPLKRIALVNAAAFLWNHHDIKTSVTKFINSELFTQIDDDLYLGQYISTERKTNWLQIEKEVFQKMPEFAEEEQAILKEEILSYIQLVGLQILKWMEYHRRYYRLNLDLPNRFFFTLEGIVDKKKTAEELVKNESIDITTRYKLACINCLEKDVLQLWNRMPENIQKSLLIDEKIGNSTQTDLLIFWQMYLNGKVAELGKMIRRKINRKCSVYRYMFRCAADNGNKAATEYFLQKVFPREKSLIKTALYVLRKRRECFPRITDPPKEYYSEVFCFLLSHMKNKQQVKVFEKNPTNVLYCLLDWPWQKNFLNTAIQMWDFLEESDYQSIFWMILHKRIFHCLDYDYKKLFKELWLQTPHPRKRFIIEDSIGGLIDLLFEVNDEENLILVIQDEAFEEKDEFITSSIGFHFCEDKFQQEDLFKVFFQLFILSKDEMIRFKQKYEEFIERRKIDNENERTRRLADREARRIHNERSRRLLVERDRRGFEEFRENRIQQILEREERPGIIDLEGQESDHELIDLAEDEADNEIFIPFPHADDDQVIRSSDRVNHKQIGFLKFLDDLICGYDKRKNNDEDNSNAAKRLCNVD